MAIEITWVEAHPKEDLLALSLQNGQVVVWDSRKGAVVRRLPHQGWIVNLRWSPDGERLVVAEEGGRLSVYDRGGEKLHTVESGHERLRSSAFHAGGKWFVSGGSVGRVAVWNAADFKEAFRLPLEKGGPVSAVGFAGEALVIGFEDGYFEAWVDDGKENVAAGAILNGRVASLAANPAGTVVMFGGGKGSMVAISAGEQWTCLESYKGTPPKPISVNQISWSPDGDFFVAACSDGTAKLMDWKERKTLESNLGTPFYLRSPKPEWDRSLIVASACFDRARPLLYSAHFDGRVQVWKRKLDFYWPEAVRLSFDEAGVPSLSDGDGTIDSSMWELNLG